MTSEALICASTMSYMLETMPSWIPAKQNGRAVKVTYTLPIVFSAVS